MPSVQKLERFGEVPADYDLALVPSAKVTTAKPLKATSLAKGATLSAEKGWASMA